MIFGELFCSSTCVITIIYKSIDWEGGEEG